MKILLYIITCLVFFVGCTPLENPDNDDSRMTHKIFKESNKTFPNPERGFYAGRNWYSAEDKITSQPWINAMRIQGITLVYTGYYLTDFMESDISQAFLDMIDANMQALREGGMKCVLRFAYKTDMYETGHPWDAAPEWVHRHIEQLKPVMQRNSDVVLCLQAGFIGVWGEWGYTDHFVQGPTTPEDHALRKEVMLALLDAMPEDRQIALRTPMFKKRMFLESYADSITFETAYNGSDLSRICAHNDCFGADAHDMGTFTETGAREFWQKETKYVIMGGETCVLSKYCNCNLIIPDFEDYHWTYVSGPKVIENHWEANGCLDEIKRRLGYRLTLTEVSHTAKPVRGKDMKVVVELKNTGFAAPANTRKVEFVLVDENGTKTIFSCPDADPRYWFAGEKVNIEKTITIPEDAMGECRLYLNLPDGKESLYDNPRFSIRLANDKIWDEDTGYNKLTEFKL